MTAAEYSQIISLFLGSVSAACFVFGVTFLGGGR